MTIEPDTVATIADRLATAWPGTTLTSDPKELSGGFWATMHRLNVRGQPPEVPADLVFRAAPDAAMAAKEVAVQRAVASIGYPTPAIRLASATDSADGGPWSVMDFAPGSPPIGALDGVAALRRAVGLLRQLPAQLATPMAALHDLEPAAVTAAVAAEAPAVAWDVETLLGHFAAGAASLERPDLLEVVAALAERQPERRAEVVCHGDLHPFNLLVDDDGTTTVLDWTGAILADPAYDLAYTSMLLAAPPLPAPRPIAALIRGIGARLAERFLASYRSLAPRTDVGNLGWYRALHSTRMLLELASMEANRPESVADHPFSALRTPIERALTQELAAPLPPSG